MGHTRGKLWTPEEDERILDLLAGGLSARQIAAEVGEVTRNAVIGRIMRAKALKDHGFAYKAGEQLRTRIETKRNIVIDMADAVPVAAKSLLDLRSDECKWPVSFDPEVVGNWWMCAHKQVKGHVYCAKHLRIKRRGPDYV
jgi:GcrA cell cycle regulator